jgi:hypothetical protein
MFPFDWGPSGKEQKVNQLAFALIIEEYYGNNEQETVYLFAHANYELLATSYFRTVDDRLGWELTSDQLRALLPSFGVVEPMLEIRREIVPPNIVRLASTQRKVIS